MGAADTTTRSKPDEKASGANYVVQFQNVSKSFDQGTAAVRALDDVTFSIEQGSFTCLMGPSGSGKSTLLKMIAGIDRPTQGMIMAVGENIGSLDREYLSKWRNRHIGFVFQNFQLIPVLTAFENVELPLLLTRLSRRERRAHVETALQLVGLSHRMQHRPNQLSGGEEQRTAIARAIVTDPTLILADEPTGNLDTANASEIMRIFDELNQHGKTIIMVTHDPTVAQHASTILHLGKGRLRSGD
jgi:putative ABC transport system ATP-binding protein